MAERRERPRELLEGKEELRAEMEPVLEEEPLELPPPKERKRKTKTQLKEKLTPASQTRHALDERRFVLEQEIATQKMKEQKLSGVLEAAERTVKKLEKEYAAAWWFSRGRLRDDLETARQSAQLIKNSLKEETNDRKTRESEQRKLEREEAKLLSAMQPDVREFQKLEKRESFDKTLPEMVTYIKTQKNGKREQKKEETVRMMLSTFPEFEEEIRKVFAEIT